MNFKKLIFNNIGKLFFLFFLIILYRDFLYTYRMQLENFLPYYKYQNQIIFYLTGNSEYDIQAPMNLRFLGLFIQFIIFKIVPCIELSNIKIASGLNENYVCATYSNALLNYFSLCGILSLIFKYCFDKLNQDLSTSILTTFLAYIYLQHAEAFTLDRFSIFYFILILYFLDNKLTSFFLIILCSIVNEKIIYILFILFFIRYYFNSLKKYKYHLIVTFISGLLTILIFLVYSKSLGYGYYESNLDHGLYNKFFTHGFKRIFGIFTSYSGLSNGLLPLMFSVIPFIISLKLNNIYTYNFSKIEIIIPLSMLFFTMGGGVEQTGRYVIYTFPLWLPIFSQQLVYIFKNLKQNVQ